MPSTTRVAPASIAAATASALRSPPPTCTGTPTSVAIRRTCSRLRGSPLRAPSRSTTCSARAPRLHPTPGGVERIRVVGGLLVEIAAGQSHGLAVQDVDRGQQDHRGSDPQRRREAGARAVAAQPSEAGQHLQPVPRGLLGMKLDPVDVPVGHAGREPLPVFGGSEHVAGVRGPNRERVHVVERAPAVGRPAVSALGRSNRTSFQPMCGTRNPPALIGVTRPPISPRPGVEPNSSEVSNSTCIPRQMPEQRPSAVGVAAHGGIKAKLGELAHRVREGAHPGDHEAVRGVDHGRIASDLRLRTDRLQRLLHRAPVAHPVVQDSDARAGVQDRVPFVLGTPCSVGSIAVAARSARAKALKTASIT